ncbi:MAG: flagellar protein FliS [Nitrospirota bacterium]
MTAPPRVAGSALPSWWAPAAPTDAGVASIDRVVVLLYSEALARLRRARHARAGRRRDVHAVVAILMELSNALTQREEPDNVVDLVSLYRYMMHRLTAATDHRSDQACDDALAEVERLFSTLMDGWIQVLPPGPDSSFPAPAEADDPRSLPPLFPAHSSPTED